MKTFYATFGASDRRSGWIVEILAEDRNEANEKMFTAFGSRWAFLYSDVNTIDPRDKERGILKTL